METEPALYLVRGKTTIRAPYSSSASLLQVDLAFYPHVLLGRGIHFFKEHLHSLRESLERQLLTIPLFR